MARLWVAAATLPQKQDLAAIIHLCGAGAGAPMPRGLCMTAGQQHGAHPTGRYPAQVKPREAAVRPPHRGGSGDTSHAPPHLATQPTIALVRQRQLVLGADLLKEGDALVEVVLCQWPF